MWWKGEINDSLVSPLPRSNRIVFYTITNDRTKGRKDRQTYRDIECGKKERQKDTKTEIEKERNIERQKYRKTEI
jgi:hypothetical protein